MVKSDIRRVVWASVDHFLRLKEWKAIERTNLVLVFIKNNAHLRRSSRRSDNATSRYKEHPPAITKKGAWHFRKSVPRPALYIYCDISQLGNGLIIIVWLVLAWTLPFPGVTSMLKAHSWKTLQLRCPQQLASQMRAS